MTVLRGLGVHLFARWMGDLGRLLELRKSFFLGLIELPIRVVRFDMRDIQSCCRSTYQLRYRYHTGRYNMAVCWLLFGVVLLACLLVFFCVNFCVFCALLRCLLLHSNEYIKLAACVVICTYVQAWVCFWLSDVIVRNAAFVSCVDGGVEEYLEEEIGCSTRNHQVLC